jgi:hypothetical protein
VSSTAAEVSVVVVSTCAKVWCVLLLLIHTDIEYIWIPVVLLAKNSAQMESARKSSTVCTVCVYSMCVSVYQSINQSMLVSPFLMFYFTTVSSLCYGIVALAVGVLIVAVAAVVMSMLQCCNRDCNTAIAPILLLLMSYCYCFCC